MAIHYAGAWKNLRAHTSLNQRTLRAIAALAVVLLVPIVSLSLLTDAGAAPGDSVTAHGCTVIPRPPDAVDGQLFAQVKVKCATDKSGRFILIELSERRGDGTWDVIAGASNRLQVPEDLTDNNLPPSQVDDYDDVDGPLVTCPRVDATRSFRTVVTLSDGQGNEEKTVSESVERYRNCFDLEPVPISESRDEVIPEGCSAGEICTESHLVKRDESYGCRVVAHNPVKLQTRLVGEGDFNCDTPLVRRLVYVRICDDVRGSGDPCEGRISRFVKRGNKDWTWEPSCRATPVTRIWPFEYRGTYTQVGIDPGRQEDFDNPDDRHIDSPRTKFDWDCSPAPNG